MLIKSVINIKIKYFQSKKLFFKDFFKDIKIKYLQFYSVCFLILVNLKKITNKLLDYINLIKTLTFYISKVLKIIIVHKNENFILTTF